MKGKELLQKIGYMKGQEKFTFRTLLILTVCLAIAVLFALSHESRMEKPLQVLVVANRMDESCWNAFHYGLKQAAQENHIVLTIASAGNAGEMERVLMREEAEGKDGLIFQPFYGEGAGMIPAGLPSVQVESRGESAKEEVLPDAHKIGEAVAKGILEDFEGDLRGKKIGILQEKKDRSFAADCAEGFERGIEGAGGSVEWKVENLYAKDEPQERLSGLEVVDIVVALDNDDLVLAGECALQKNLHGAIVYGVGSSTEAAYYLDRNMVRLLVVPDTFTMGYRALTVLNSRMRGGLLQRISPFQKTETVEVPFMVLRREQLFSKKNQMLLYAMNQ